MALVGLEAQRLEALAAQLGDRCACFEADVTDPAALERAVAGTVRRFGGLDVAIANAGIHIEGALATMDPEKVESVLEVNLLGVWRTDRAVLSHVIERRGYLLNISSLSALVNVPLMGPYAASKAGVEALTNVLRMELASSGPGWDARTSASSTPTSSATPLPLPPLASCASRCPPSSASLAVYGGQRHRARNRPAVRTRVGRRATCWGHTWDAGCWRRCPNDGRWAPRCSTRCSSSPARPPPALGERRSRWPPSARTGGSEAIA